VNLAFSKSLPQKGRFAGSVTRIPDMIDFATARRQMVDGQVRTYDVTDQSVLAAMLAVPREIFVSGALQKVAYSDLDIPVSGGAGGRRLLKPMVFAKLLQAAEIAPNDRVLDVGCATGYSTAVLARLAGSVVGLEQDPKLAAQAREALAKLGAANTTVVHGPHAAGCAERAPYDVIIVNGAIEAVPETLVRQLAEGGRLACIRGEGPVGKATLLSVTHGETSERVIFDAAGPVLPGFARPPVFVF
jgi:protein-L-isoaspartate(D-aspartate) O-methyltransferase